MKTYRVGIIGLGRMGSTIDDEGHAVKPYSIAACCEVIDRLELVAGSDLQADKRAAFTGRWGVAGVYEDYLEMVAQESLDLVAVCTTASGLFKPANRSTRCQFQGRFACGFDREPCQCWGADVVCGEGDGEFDGAGRRDFGSGEKPMVLCLIRVF